MIDTTTDFFEEQLEIAKDNLSKTKGKYNEEDYMLVRTTDYLPEDHVLKPLCNIPFVCKTNSRLAYVIFQKIVKEYNLNPFNIPEEQQKIIDEMKPYSTQYRSTIHFTLNGLVSSHMMGDFDNRNFIIIDKLKNYINSENLHTLRPEDTFFVGNVKLSDDAVILVDIDKYNELVEKKPFLSSYNIILYRGNQKLAVESYLVSQGIVPQMINAHGYENYSNMEPLNGIFNLVEKYNFNQEPHSLSEPYKEDDIKNIELWDIYNKDLYKKLFDKFNINNEDLYIELINGDMFRQEEILQQILSNISFEQCFDFIKEYNDSIIEKINNGEYLTNNEILDKKSLESSRKVSI